MAEFKDALDRTWKPRITVADLKPLRDDLQFDVRNLADDAGLGRLILTQPESLVAVLFLLSKPPKDVTPDDFAAGFDGDALERGGDALLEAVADFFPRSRVSGWMKTKLRERMKDVDDNLIRFLESNDSATSLPESPESMTPAP